MMQIKKLRKKTTMPDLTKINRTIRDIRKENHAEDLILWNLDFTFYLEKDPCESEKTISACNNNYIRYKSKIDKDKTQRLNSAMFKWYNKWL